jgi:competence protein ComEC
MIAACAAADIVVSDRTLPKACQPRWLKADRPFLQHHGGLSLDLRGAPTLTTVRQAVGRHPWAAN